ncbi:hypothetical protein Rs2_02885 [Raphanus sativus]|nr:hypothetical protein Rs2_02885 [Raphanus sativus]
MLITNRAATPPTTLICIRDVVEMMSVREWYTELIIYLTSGVKVVAPYQFRRWTDFHVGPTPFVFSDASENDVIVVPNENNEQEIDSLPIKNISNLPLYPDGNGTDLHVTVTLNLGVNMEEDGYTVQTVEEGNISNLPVYRDANGSCDSVTHNLVWIWRKILMRFKRLKNVDRMMVILHLYLQ